jgi:hypothetical protein
MAQPIRAQNFTGFVVRGCGTVSVPRWLASVAPATVTMTRGPNEKRDLGKRLKVPCQSFSRP